jgi:hypothetical protein
MFVSDDLHGSRVVPTRPLAHVVLGAQLAWASTREKVFGEWVESCIRSCNHAALPRELVRVGRLWRQGGVERCPLSLYARNDAKAATWLILPVVICLSQRLSHACLSIRGHCSLETANGSLNQLLFI